MGRTPRIGCVAFGKDPGNHWGLVGSSALSAVDLRLWSGKTLKGPSRACGFAIPWAGWSRLEVVLEVVEWMAGMELDLYGPFPPKPFQDSMIPVL